MAVSVVGVWSMRVIVLDFFVSVQMRMEAVWGNFGISVLVRMVPVIMPVAVLVLNRWMNVQMTVFFPEQQCSSHDHDRD